MSEHTFHSVASFIESELAAGTFPGVGLIMALNGATVRHYIPEYCGGWRDATTIRHLLTHAAGIQNCPMRAAYSEEEWRACLQSCDAKVEFEPATRTPYHWTSGLLLASEAVRRALGMASWEAICREFLLDPIGAKNLTFRIPEHSCVALSSQPKELPCAIDTAEREGTPVNHEPSGLGWLLKRNRINHCSGWARQQVPARSTMRALTL